MGGRSGHAVVAAHSPAEVGTPAAGGKDPEAGSPEVAARTANARAVVDTRAAAGRGAPAAGSLAAGPGSTTPVVVAAQQVEVAGTDWRLVEVPVAVLHTEERLRTAACNTGRSHRGRRQRRRSPEQVQAAAAAVGSCWTHGADYRSRRRISHAPSRTGPVARRGPAHKGPGLEVAGHGSRTGRSAGAASTGLLYAPAVAHRGRVCWPWKAHTHRPGARRGPGHAPRPASAVVHLLAVAPVLAAARWRARTNRSAHGLRRHGEVKQEACVACALSTSRGPLDVHPVPPHPQGHTPATPSTSRPCAPSARMRYPGTGPLAAAT